MAHKPGRRGRRVNATGRSIGSGHHVRFYRWELDSPAYRSLSIGARALLIELKALYMGSNNGALFLSVRRAAEKLNSSRGFAAARFLELQDRGFIRPNEIGAFSVKCLVGNGRATSWILTEYPIGDAPGVGAKDFMHWRPPEKQNAVHPRGRSVHPGGRSPQKQPEKAESVRPHGRFTPQIVVSRSTPVDTVNIPGEVA
jgi:hypothetical protein